MNNDKYKNIIKTYKLSSGEIYTKNDNNYYSVKFSPKTFNSIKFTQTNITNEIQTKIIFNNIDPVDIRNILHDIRSSIGIISATLFLCNANDKIKELLKVDDCASNEFNEIKTLLSQGNQDSEEQLELIEKKQTQIGTIEINLSYLLKELFPKYCSELIIDDSLNININFNLDLLTKIVEKMINSSGVIMARIVNKYLELIDLEKSKIIQKFRFG